MIGPAATALVAFVAFAIATPVPVNQMPRGLLGGQLTWYTEGMGVSPTACGTVHQVTEHIAALSPTDYGIFANPNNSPACGKQIRVHGDNGHSVVATVADRCAGCTGHNVDVTPAVFMALGYGEDVGRVEITWEYL